MGTLVLSCVSEEESDGPDTTDLVGQDGNPRFNLQFTNAAKVDLDLYVRTPSGAVISYLNRSADQGTLDVDCKCSSCASGPNENIYWVEGTAPAGQYEYWIKYFNNCGTDGASSTFSIRVIKNGSVISTKTGTLNAVGESTHWFHSNY